MLCKRMSRRYLLKLTGMGAAGVVLAACAPKVVQKEVTRVVKEMVKETVIVEGTPKVVEKEITRIVKETVVVEGKEKEVTAKPTYARKIVRLQTMFEGELHTYMSENVYSKFTEETGVEIQTLIVPYSDDAIIKLQTMAASGDLGDVAMDLTMWSRSFIGNGMNLDLSEAIESYSFDYADYSDGNPLAKVYDVDGKIYGMAFEVAVQACIYVPQLFEEAGLKEPGPGWSNEDLIEAARKLTIRKGDEVVQWGLGTDPGSGWARECFLETADAPMIKDDNVTPEANHPDAVRLMQSYADLRFKDKALPTKTEIAQLQAAGDIGLMPAIYAGQIAIHFACCWKMRSLTQYGKVPFKFAPLPKVKRDGNAAAGTAYFVYSKTKVPDEACQLLFALLDRDVQILSGDKQGWTPTTKSARVNFFEKFEGNPDNYMLLNDLLASGRPAPSTLVMGKSMEIGRIDAQRMSQLWEENKPAQQVLDQIQEDIQEAMARGD